MHLIGGGFDLLPRIQDGARGLNSDQRASNDAAGSAAHRSVQASGNLTGKQAAL
jgi:hypothetical protein